MITLAAFSTVLKSQHATCVTSTPATSSARSTAASTAGSTPPGTPYAPSRAAVSSPGAGAVKPGSISRIPSSTAATSLPIGPRVSSDGASGYTPFTETRPRAVVSPTTPQHAAGMRFEPAVSVPNPTSASPVATATVDPLEEPPGTRRGSLGFTGVPAQWFTPLADQHSSVSAVFPATCAPASRADATTAASLTAGSAISATTGHPAVVGTPATSMQSFTASRGPAPSGAIRTIHVPMTP
jgi:hypothetical protein